MEGKQRLLQSLQGLGLSGYEAQAYLAALRHPPLTGYQLSKASGVPRSRIYETVEKLSAKGLLVSQPGARNLLTAVDHRAFLDQKEKDSSETIRFLRETLKTLSTPEPAGIWTLTGREPILEAAADLISQAGRYVYLVAVATDLIALAAALSNGGKVRVPIHGVYCGEGASALPGMIRHLGPCCSADSEIALVVDGDRALIGCTGGDDSASAALTRNKGVVAIAKQYIKHEVFFNTLYGAQDDAAIQAYVRKYDRMMKKLP